jgi:LuxR family maltose regulon positive regulatory protein
MQTAYSAEPSLPFVLLDRDASAAPDHVVTARLDELHGLMEQTRDEIAALRALNERLLEIVETERETAAEVPAAASPPASRLSISLLGAFEVRAGENAVQGWRSRKARQLLAYLALEPDRPVARETLIETFWPESEPARGGNNLSIAVHHVRTRLGEILESGDGSRGISVQQRLYRLDPEFDWLIDAVEFRRHVANARAALGAEREEEARTALEAALQHYGGDLLESDLTEEWTHDPRQALAGLFEWAAGWLAEDAARRQEWQRVVQHGQLIVGRDPGDEAGHRWLIRAYAALGNRSQALRQYEVCEQRLREEFGVAPSDETRSLIEELRL